MGSVSALYTKRGSLLKSRLFIGIFVCVILLSTAYAQSAVNERFSRYFDRIEAGETVVFVDVEAISLVRITMDVADLAYNVRVYLSTFSYNPSGLPVIDNPYQYHNLLVTNLDESLINSAEMEFRIPKQWLSDNTIDEDTVALHRLENNQWKKLDTQKVADDVSYVYYRATTEGFAYFVINGAQKKAQAVAAPIVEKIETPNVKPGDASQEDTEQNVAPPPEQPAVAQEAVFFSGHMLYLLLAGLLAVSVGSYAIVRKYKPKSVHGMDLLIADVNPGKYLHCANNFVIKNLYDLREALETMDDETYKKHVHEDTNDFATWATTALADHPLGLKLRMSQNRESMLTHVVHKIARLEQKQLVRIISKKYGMFPQKTRELLEFIKNSRESGLDDKQIIQKLLSQKYSRQLVYDLIYGAFDDIEDIVIHPEDEAQIDRYILDASRKKEDYLEIKQDLLDAGWPRFIIEKKMQEHFKKITV